LWPSWTGQAGRSFPGGSRTPWIPRSVLRPLKRRSPATGRHRYSTPTRAVSFTADAFIRILKTHNIRISMDGRAAGWTTSSSRGSGRASNMKRYISRLTTQLPRPGRNLQSTFDRYNKRRRHQGLDNMTPDEVYWDTIPKLKEAV